MSNQETGIVKAVEASLWQREEAIRSILPNGMDMKRFVKTAMIALSKNPDLQRCTQESIVRSIIEAAEAGLEPTGMLSRAWLVPYNNKGVAEAQLQIGYQGLIDLARRSGEVRKIVARVVFEGDDFRVLQGSVERVDHEPAGMTEDPLKIIAVYAVATFKDGTSQHEVMSKSQVDMVRSRAKAKNAAAWTESYPEMARKTVVRRLAKYLPLTVEAVEAIAKDDEREYGTPTVAQATGTRTSSLREAIKAQADEIKPQAEEIEGEAIEVPVESADQPTEPPVSQTPPVARPVQQPVKTEQSAEQAGKAAQAAFEADFNAKQKAAIDKTSSQALPSAAEAAAWARGGRV
jgi:recombination protein RecT